MITTIHKEFSDVFEKISIARTYSYNAMISAGKEDYDLLHKDYKDMKAALKLLSVTVEDLDRKVSAELSELEL